MSVSVTFTQTSNGSQAVTISAAVVYGTNFYDKRLNQYTLRTADGGTVVYDAGPDQVHGVMVMKNVSYSDGENFRKWIRGDYSGGTDEGITYGKSKFKISALTDIDLGIGKNTELSVAGGATEDAYYDGDIDMSGVFDYLAPGLYKINFPYRFIR